MKLIKYILLSIFLIFIIFILYFFSYFKTNLNYPPQLLVNTLITSYSKSKQLPQKINFLILGGDYRHDWLEQNIDTDTIILASLNIKSNNLSLIPIPRDLWFYPTDSRINKIYQLSLNQPDPFAYIKTNFTQITGQHIDHILIINTDVLSNIITLIGPVNLDLPYSIVDDQYPNPSYIKDPQNNPNPYITIQFNQGQNIIDATNVDYFVRSRKGSDVDNGGSDLGRSNRQQLLIMAIFDNLKQTSFLKQSAKISSLYKLYSTQIIKDIPDELLLSIGLKLNKDLLNLKITTISIPIGKNYLDKSGVIYHPTYFQAGAWVYLPFGNDYKNLSSHIDSSLN